MLLSSLAVAGCLDGSAGQTEPGAGLQAASNIKAQVIYVDPQGAYGLIQAESPPVILDVRTAAELSSGIIDGAVHRDFRSGDFAASLAGLPPDRPILVTCASGGRSSRSLAVLQRAGFTNLLHLDGGMRAWAAAGLPVAKPGSDFQ